MSKCKCEELKGRGANKIEELMEKWKEKENPSLPRISREKEQACLFGQPSCVATHTIFLQLTQPPIMGFLGGGLNVPFLFLPAQYCFNACIKIVCTHLTFITFFPWGWSICLIIPHVVLLTQYTAFNCIQWLLITMDHNSCQTYSREELLGLARKFSSINLVKRTIGARV